MRIGRYTLLGLTLALANLSQAAILVHLRNGTAIEAQSQTIDTDVVCLKIDKGTVELNSGEIDWVETLPEAPVAPRQIQNKPADLLSVAQALKEASDSQALPADFVKTVANVESGLRPDAVSPKGARGLMQLMPGTAGELGVKADVLSENALGGAKYLRALLIRYHGDARLALAAYNAGPAAVDRYHGIPPYPETVAYVTKVLKQYELLEKASHQGTK